MKAYSDIVIKGCLVHDVLGSLRELRHIKNSNKAYIIDRPPKQFGLVSVDMCH